jgi:hypothetical protein
MRTTAILLFLCFVSSAETISGTVTSSQAPLAGVNIRARNVATGIVVEGETSVLGAYMLTVPTGSFDVFVRKVGYSLMTRRDVAVKTGADIHVDAALIPQANTGVPGEQAFQILGEKAERVAGPAPKTADGKPDLSGVWLAGGPDMDADDPPYRPWAAALQKERLADGSKDDPRAHCLPSGAVRTNALDLTKFIQIPSELIILSEGSPPGFRQIFMDGSGHPADFDPTWMGHSIGKWIGDTLEIDTVGFHDRGWIDVTGKPQTEQLHVIERMRRPDLGTMEIEITVDDPGAYEHPWKLRRSLKLAPKEELHEYVCNENEKPEHFVGK